MQAEADDLVSVFLVWNGTQLDHHVCVVVDKEFVSIFVAEWHFGVVLGFAFIGEEGSGDLVERWRPCIPLFDQLLELLYCLLEPDLGAHLGGMVKSLG